MRLLFTGKLCQRPPRRSAPPLLFKEGSLNRIAAVTAVFWLLGSISLLKAQGSQQQVVTKYCVGCHNERAKTGGLSLEKLDADHPAADAETWEKAIRKLRAGLMPPSGAARPDRATLESLRTALESGIDTAAAQHKNPGVTALHRLNRAGYCECHPGPDQRRYRCFNDVARR